MGGWVGDDPASGEIKLRYLKSDVTCGEGHFVQISSAWQPRFDGHTLRPSPLIGVFFISCMCRTPDYGMALVCCMIATAATDMRSKRSMRA